MSCPAPASAVAEQATAWNGVKPRSRDTTPNAAPMGRSRGRWGSPSARPRMKRARLGGHATCLEVGRRHAVILAQHAEPSRRYDRRGTRGGETGGVHTHLPQRWSCRVGLEDISTVIFRGPERSRLSSCARSAAPHYVPRFASPTCSWPLWSWRGTPRTWRRADPRDASPRSRETGRSRRRLGRRSRAARPQGARRRAVLRVFPPSACICGVRGGPAGRARVAS